MKQYLIILIAIGIVLIGLSFVRFFIGGNEDDWIKDEKGQYIQHGKPGFFPDYVAEQQQAIICAIGLYEQAKSEGMQFSSQCLGTCNNYTVDIVHVPRTSEDNLAENQCSYFREGKVSKFIELDKNGEIVRIA